MPNYAPSDLVRQPVIHRPPKTSKSMRHNMTKHQKTNTPSLKWIIRVVPATTAHNSYITIVPLTTHPRRYPLYHRLPSRRLCSACPASSPSRSAVAQHGRQASGGPSPAPLAECLGNDPCGHTDADDGKRRLRGQQSLPPHVCNYLLAHACDETS